MNTQASFTHPRVVPNLNDFISSVEHKRRCFEECSENVMKVNGDQHLSISKKDKNILYLYFMDVR